MNHVSSIQLCAFLDDVLVGAPDDQTARHLATCATCRARYEAWCHVDDSLRELLGQDADEHAMEQRTAWVEIAVTAERKGLPAPEFGDLRIRLEHNPPPVLRTEMPHAGTPRAAAPPKAAPPLEVLPHSHFLAPQQAAGPGVPAPAAGSSAMLKRPVLHVPQQAPAVGAHAHAPVAAGGHAKPARGATPEASPAPRAQGYARRPHAAPRGLAALASRPGLWLALLLAAGLVAAIPIAIARIKSAMRVQQEREADVRRAVLDEPAERERDTKPARTGKSPARSKTPSPAPVAKETPPELDTPADASILFDLPALEPEDSEPEPVVTPPNRLAPVEERNATESGSEGETKSGTTSPRICGEVLSMQGTPIEGARVYLASPTRMVRTDRQGRFCVVCPPGPRTVRIEASGRASVTRTLRLGNERLETRFTLGAAN